jgi:hypothetical protein
VTLPSIQQLARRRLSIFAGAIAGIAAASAWAAWFHNFAPFADERTSAWSAPAGDSPDARKPAALYQPRIDGLLQRIRVNGRVGGSAWQSLREAADAWLLSDPIGCLNHLSAGGALALVDEALLDEALRRSTGGNFSTALRRADELTDPRAYRLWLTRAFSLETQTNPESALLALNSVPPQLRWIFRSDLAEAWFKKDGPAAFAAFRANAPSSVVLVIDDWLRHDPKSALAYFSQSPEVIPLEPGRSVPRSQMLCGAIVSLAKTDPAKSLELLQELPNGEQEEYARRYIFGQLAGRDPTAALTAAEALPGDIARINAQSTIADAIAASDPDTAAQIRESLPGESAREGNQPMQIWDANASNPTTAAEKSAALEDPVLRSDAMHTVAANWVINKPADAVAYAVQQAQNGDPAWLATLSDEIVDWAGPSGVMHNFVDRWISQVQNLDASARALWQRELEAQPAGPARDRLLQAIQ